MVGTDDSTIDFPSPSPGSTPGDLLGRLRADGAPPRRYRIAGEVARGGMGAIFEVFDDSLRRSLAMKVVLQETSQGSATPASDEVDPHRMARFVEEAQITGQLEHPGIVPVHELGIDDEGRAYFTMQLVRGRDLEAVLQLVDRREEGWTVTRAVGVVLRVCEAMAFAHDRKVLHRDLKPANVMVGSFGEVYVMDWGLARVIGAPDLHDVRLQDPRRHGRPIATDRSELSGSDAELRTMDGAVVGTPAYMSPEQARGEVEALDGRTDVYAVGAMLYRLLGGRPPYAREGASPASVLMELLEGPPEPLAPLCPRAPQELVAIAEKAMARAPEDRYPTMLALADDLRAFLENRVVAAFETGAWAEARKWVRRNRGMAASLAAAVLVLVLGLVVSLVLRAEAHRQAVLAGIASAEAKANAESAEEARAAFAVKAEEARREAKIARAVNSFLNDDVLAAIAPEHMGVDVTVRQVLEQAALQLDWTFQDEPAVESALRLTIGRSYERLGEWQRAVSSFRRALELRERELGADATGTIEARLCVAGAQSSLGLDAAAEASYEAARASLERGQEAQHPGWGVVTNGLGLLRLSQGRPGEARTCFEESLAWHERVAADDEQTRVVRVNLGRLLADLGEFERAEALLVPVLAERRRDLGAKHPSTLDACTAVARLRRAQGRFAESERLFSALVRDREGMLGVEHPMSAIARCDLGNVRVDLHRYDEAIADLRAAHAVFDRLLGAEHSETLRTASNLASALVQSGDVEQGRAWTERALEAQRRVLGGEHVDTLRSMANLASLYNDLGRFDEAESLGREVLALEERVYGPQAPTVLITRENLGRTLLSLGRPAEAAMLVEDVLSARRRILGEEHPAVSRSMFNLARTLADAGEAERAESLYMDVLPRWRAEFGERAAQVADVLVQLASLRRARGDHEASIAALREALAIRLEVFGEDAAATTVLMHDVGLALVKAGNPEEGVRQLQRAFAIRRRVHGEDHGYTRTTSFVLGWALIQAGRHADAEPILLDFTRDREADVGLADETCRRAIELLVETYEALGRQDDAAAWRAKIE
jgi:serine/threonine protein kinase